MVGISFEYRANTNKAKGAPIDLVFPKEGLGWDLEAFAIHKGTKKLAAAKKLADWASSKDAMLLYGKNFAITAQPGVAAPLANVPKDYEARLVKMDFATDRRQPRTRAGRVDQALQQQDREEMTHPRSGFQPLPPQGERARAERAPARLRVAGERPSPCKAKGDTSGPAKPDPRCPLGNCGPRDD